MRGTDFPPVCEFSCRVLNLCSGELRGLQHSEYVDLVIAGIGSLFPVLSLSALGTCRGNYCPEHLPAFAGIRRYLVPCCVYVFAFFFFFRQPNLNLKKCMLCICRKNNLLVRKCKIPFVLDSPEDFQRCLTWQTGACQPQKVWEGLINPDTVCLAEKIAIWPVQGGATLLKCRKSWHSISMIW